MILAATDWLTISINLLLIVFVIVCLLMTLMVLMQRPKQEGLGAAFGGGMTDQMFGARTTNVLQRGTVWCASLFFVLALALAVLIGMKNGRTESLIVKEEAEEAAEVAAAPAAEEPEVVETIRSLIEEEHATAIAEETPIEEIELPITITPEESAAEEAAGVEAGDQPAAPEENSEAQ